jgi:two-component system, cell cycle response regulator
MNNMTDSMPTRFSQSFGLRAQQGNLDQLSGCLVRIYPAEGIGEVYDLGDEPIVIGRDLSCDLQLNDDSVSRQHATLEPAAGGYILTDRGSTNGTYVNDQRIERRKLTTCDRLRFGNQIVKFLSADRMEVEYHETVYKIMTTDGLTQAYNKRYLLEVVEREFHRASRTGQPLSVLMVDVDWFKQINDTHGHLAGDEVLGELCRRIHGVLRRDEVLARYGGEEFVLVMSDTSLDEACEAGERLRRAVADHPFASEQAAINVTVSVGVASTEGCSLAGPTELIEQADQRLYAAKQSGRNRVVGAQQTSAVPC